MPLRRTGIVLAAAALSALPLPVAAQSLPALDPNEQVTITFYNYNLAAAGLGRDATNELIDGFMALNPNIKVEGVPVNSAEVTQRVQTDIAAGNTPDLAQLVFGDLEFVVTNLGVQAVDDIIPPQEWADHTADMVSNGLQLGKFAGKTYGLAYTFSTPIVFYNADLFRAAGLDPDAPPTTWAEVKEAALKIKDATDAEGVFAGGGFLQTLIQSNGGHTLSEDRKRLTFAEPAAVEAVAMLRDLYDSGAMPAMTLAAANEAMSAGNLGMLLYTSAGTDFLMKSAKDKWELRVAKEPQFGDKAAVPVNTGSGLFILSSDPKKQRAAWELMKYLTSEIGYTIITSKIGYLPLRLNIVDDPKYLGEFAKTSPMLRPNIEQLSRLQPWVSMPGPNYKQIEKIMSEAVEQAVFGGGEVEATLKAAQEQAQALILN